MVTPCARLQVSPTDKGKDYVYVGTEMPSFGYDFYYVP
jgi:hypothetical protein